MAGNIREQYATGFVTSKNGTTIGYRKLGRGPAVVLLHGGLESAQSHMQLGEALAGSFTVFLPDRRGRGLSGPYSPDFSLQKEVEDMEAVLSETGAQLVFGVSSGAIIWLQTALTSSTIHKAAIYEPPILMNKPETLLRQFDNEMAQGKVAKAFVTVSKATKVAPAITSLIPNWLMEPLVEKMMLSEAKKAVDGDISLRSVVPTFHYDAQIVVEIGGKADRFQGVSAEVLLLGGSQSAPYLKRGLDELEQVLPHVVKRVAIPGVGHLGSSNTNEGGKPDLVAKELMEFIF